MNDDKNLNENQLHGEQEDDLIAQIRDSADAEGESSPVVKSALWAPKEIRYTPMTWVIRGVSLVLLIIIAIEGFIIAKKLSEKPVPGVGGVPTIVILPAPAVGEHEDDNIEYVAYPEDDSVDYPDPPTPTPEPAVPFPDDLDVEIAPPEE
jgi:hypothetical protein